MNNVPTHLKHKPIIAIDYEQNDAEAGDAKSLSIGVASWNKKDENDNNTAYSAKIFRWLEESGRWSPQSEELPLWRVIDLAIFVIAVIKDLPSGLGEEPIDVVKFAELRAHINGIKNYKDDEDKKKFFEIYKEKINRLKKIINQ